MAKVSYKYPLKTYRRPWSKKKRSPMSCHWNKKKLETLSPHFNPIPFSPKKRHLAIASHQVLLTRLGLWNFLNLEFDQMIRTDLIKELVVCYNPKRHSQKSHVHGMLIDLSGLALATALLLPANDEEGKITVVSQEEASFVEELIWDWLVLRDDDSEVVDKAVLNIKMCIKELRFEKIDWAKLIWCMVKRELLMGKKLINCYYASHLQLLLKSQRPRLFDDHVESVGSSDIGANAGAVKMLELEDSEKGNGGIVLFDEKLERESRISVGKDIMGLKGSETGHVENFFDKREEELHDIQVDLIAKKHNSDCVDALMEKVNQEYPCIYESSSKRGDWNVEQEASGLNESLAVCMDYLQASLNAMPGKIESIHVVESEGDDDTLLEYEEKDKGKCQINDINTSERFVLPHCTPGNVEEHEASKEKGQAQDTECYDSHKECRQTENLYSAHRVQLTGAKEVIHNPPNFNVHHSFVEPFVPNLHMHMETLIPSVHEKALQNKDTSKTEIFMGDFAYENDMYMNFAGPSRDNPATREIDCLDGGHHGHGMENKEAIVSNDAYEGESMDLDFCTEKVEIWMERLKNAARKQGQSDHEINGMLLKKLEGQNQTIQQYETMRQKEQQQRQKEVRYERELHLMQNILQDCKKALKEVHKSFAKYRERYRLPDESVYMDHPSGGGRLIPVATWKKLEQERKKKARAMIETMMKNFEHEWVSFKNHLLNFDLLSDKLEGVDMEI